MLKLFFVLLFLYVHSFAFSQSFESDIFKTICNELLKRNEYYTIKQELNNITLAEDIDGRVYIKTEDTLDNAYLVFVKKYNKEEQVQILSSEQLPFLPLKDTIVMVDTMDVFQSHLYIKDGIVFNVVNSEKDIQVINGNNQIIYLYKLAFRDNDLFIAFTFKNIKKYITCCFNLEKSSISLKNLFCGNTDNSKE
jgi:hypothetical protein